MEAEGLCFEVHGAAWRRGAAVPALDALECALAFVPRDQAGVRMHGVPGLHALLTPDGPLGRAAADLVGPGARPVRALLFDKNEATNWALGWHQDRTVAVAARHPVPGFGPWTMKRGVVHVAPPFALLEKMVTLRVHLDPVDEANAPLLIAPASHRALVSEAEIAGEVARRGSLACLAAAGDLWVYATPILHASEAARQPRRRRVLQVDYAAEPLPAPLVWAGI
jgi:hypothetical protein